MEVPLPFGLTEKELVLDPATRTNQSVAPGLKFLAQDANIHEVERIMTSTVLLKTAHPEYTLGECLETAIIWERG